MDLSTDELICLTDICQFLISSYSIVIIIIIIIIIIIRLYVKEKDE